MLAILVAEDVHVTVSESHRLDVLLDKIPDENPLRDVFQTLTHLTIHATTARYPSPGRQHFRACSTLDSPFSTSS